MEKRLRLLWDCARQVNIIGPDVELEYVDQLYHVYNSILSALHDYSTTAPTSYSGQMVLVRATNGIGKDAEDPISLGWKEYAVSSLAIHELPGDHFSLLNNPGSVRELVTHIQTCCI
jgi:thioesterase domain-containing protein